MRWPRKSGAIRTPRSFSGMWEPERISKPQSLGCPGLRPSMIRLAPGEVRKTERGKISLMP